MSGVKGGHRKGQVNESGTWPGSVSGLKGFGRRLNLKEMLVLHKLTREETRQQLGISYMPAGTKPNKNNSNTEVVSQEKNQTVNAAKAAAQ